MSLRRKLFGPTRREREDEAAVEMFRALMRLICVAVKAAAEVKVAEIKAAHEERDKAMVIGQ